MADNDTKPMCFGDPKVHSMADSVCRNCRFNRVCGIMVRNKERNPRGQPDRVDLPPLRSSPKSIRPTRTPDPEDFAERDEASVGFFSALFFNGALSAFRATLVEATYASDQIPRFQYPDPFRSAFKPPKRRDEEEE